VGSINMNAVCEYNNSIAINGSFACQLPACVECNRDEPTVSKDLGWLLIYDILNAIITRNAKELT